jgi:hypothetical protein
MLNEAVVHGFDAAAGHDHTSTPTSSPVITNHPAVLTSSTWAAQRPGSAAAVRGTNETLGTWAATMNSPWHRMVGYPVGALAVGYAGLGAN